MTEKSKQTALDYELTERELLALRRFRQHERGPRVCERDGAIVIDHSDVEAGIAMLLEVLGSLDGDFCRGLIEQLGKLSYRKGKLDVEALNYMLSIVKGFRPTDQIEAMLAAQMAAVHAATMNEAANLDLAENWKQHESAERTLNKLARTFAVQLEALKRYRTKGEQKITVQHVSVSDGGQAIVANVTQASGQTTKRTSKRSPAQVTDQRRPSMTILGETEPSGVPAKAALRR